MEIRQKLTLNLDSNNENHNSNTQISSHCNRVATVNDLNVRYAGTNNSGLEFTLELWEAIMDSGGPGADKFEQIAEAIRKALGVPVRDILINCLFKACDSSLGASTSMWVAYSKVGVADPREGVSGCNLSGSLESLPVLAPAQILDSRHTGYAIGTHIRHRHYCTDCGDLYEHTHTVKIQEINYLFGTLCGSCLAAPAQRIRGQNGDSGPDFGKTKAGQAGPSGFAHFPGGLPSGTSWMRVAWGFDPVYAL